MYKNKTATVLAAILFTLVLIFTTVAVMAEMSGNGAEQSAEPVPTVTPVKMPTSTPMPSPTPTPTPKPGDEPLPSPTMQPR